MDRKSITPQTIAAMAFGFIVFALALVAAMMALNALGFSISSTGVAIALAALAYVLHR